MFHCINFQVKNKILEKQNLLSLVELCDNLDNKIIEIINFIKIKIMVFYYRDNSKFLDITVYYTKNEYISIRVQL